MFELRIDDAPDVADVPALHEIRVPRIEPLSVMDSWIVAELTSPLPDTTTTTTTPTWSKKP